MESTDLEELRKTVRQTIKAGRLGTPGYLRCVALAPGPDQLDATLAELESLGQEWFGGPPVRKHRMGEGSGVFLTEMLKWPGGQGATLTVSAAPSRGSPELDLILVGSRGTLYHES